MSDALARLAESRVRNLQEEAARNRKEFPLTASIRQHFQDCNPIKEYKAHENDEHMTPTRTKVLWAIENGKQIGKPDCYSLAPDDPRWMR